MKSSNNQVDYPHKVALVKQKVWARILGLSADIHSKKTIPPFYYSTLVVHFIVLINQRVHFFLLMLGRKIKIYDSGPTFDAVPFVVNVNWCLSLSK